MPDLMSYLSGLLDWSMGKGMTLNISPEEEKAILNELIKERINDPSEVGKAELELLLKRLKEINGQSTTRIFCKKKNCYVDTATCLKRAEKDPECQSCEVYLDLTSKLPMELVEVDPRTLEDSGYDEGLFPEMSPEEQSFLTESIKTVGFFTPVVIFDNKIVCGRERVKAATAAGKETIPALKINAPEQKLRLIALVENVARKVLSGVEYKRAMDRYQELKLTSRKEIVPLDPEQAVDRIEHLPDRYKEEILRVHGEQAQEIYMDMKSQLRQLASLIKQRIDELNETIRNQRTEIEGLKLQYEEEIKRLDDESAEELYEYRKRIMDLESELKQKERDMRAEIDILRSELKDTVSREKEIQRLYEEAQKKLKNRPVVQKYPEDYEKLKEEAVQLRKRIKEMENTVDIVQRYDKHRDAFYAGFSFIRTHIDSVIKAIPKGEFRALINHFKAITKILEKRIGNEES